MNKKLVSIIIPVYNGKDYIKNCLRNLFKNTFYPRYEVIVVDDVSTDGGIEYLSNLERLRKIKLLRNEKNSGFAKTCNKGASVANGDYFVFLNMDTVPLQGWLCEMVKLLDKDEEIAACAGKWLYPGRRRVQHAGAVFSKEDMHHFHLYRYAPSFIKAVNKTREFPSISCAASLVRKDIFFKVGGFDERFLNGWEDVDLWLKIKELGYKLYYCHRSVVIHYESVAENRNFHETQNFLLFEKKWRERLERSKWKDYAEYYIEDGYDVDFINKLEEEVGFGNAFFGVEKEEDLKKGNKKSIEFFKKRVLRNARLRVSKFSQVRSKNALVSIHYALGSFYERIGDLKKAEEKFKEVITLTRGIPSFEGGAHFHLGSIYQKMKDEEKAKGHFEECLKFIPEHRKAREFLERQFTP